MYSIWKKELFKKILHKGAELLTWRWLFTSSLVSPLTFITSLICFGVATAIIMEQLCEDYNVLCMFLPLAPSG